MAYPDFHLGAYDGTTNRGDNWRDLSGAEKAALAAELADAKYSGLSDADAAQALLHRDRTGPTSETVVVSDVPRRDIIGAAGGTMFLAALKTAAESSAALQSVYDYLMNEDTFVPLDSDFQGGLALLNSIVIEAQSGVKLLSDDAMAAVIALGHTSRAIPDEQRPLGDSRAKIIGLDDLLITAADVASAKGN